MNKFPSPEIHKSFVKPHSDQNPVEIFKGINDVSDNFQVTEYDYIHFDSNKNPKIIWDSSLLENQGNKYKILKEEKEATTFERYSLISKLSEKQSQENLYDNLLKKKFRYFDYENITQKCKICKENGHNNLICPNLESNSICEKCGDKDCHNFSKCQNIKCFRCHKPNHKASVCKEKNLIKCKRCKAFGHIDLDCLIYPRITNAHISNLFSPKTYCFNQCHVHCFLCGTLNEFDHNKKLFLLNEMVGPILDTCPRCAGGHKNSECPFPKNSKSSINLRSEI
jgi:hypothetical protein